MSIWVILIEMAVFSAIFTAIVFFAASGDRKHSPAAIHNYPPDIQEEYFKTHERVDVSYRSKKVILTKSFGVAFHRYSVGLLPDCRGENLLAGLFAYLWPDGMDRHL